MNTAKCSCLGLILCSHGEDSNRGRADQFVVWSYIIELNKSMISHERNLNASRCANQISSAGGEGFISPWDTPDQQKARPITHLPVAEVRVRAAGGASGLSI